METVIGVFSSRERAEEAVAELLMARVPEQAIVFLTRSESEAKTVAKELGATVGGFMGMATGASAGVAVASLLLPGIGTVFALGFGAAALLGLAGAGTGASVGKTLADGGGRAKPTPNVVRSDSAETATIACGILDRLGLGMRGHAPVETQLATRTAADVSIVDVAGCITIGEGSVLLRDTVRQILDQGARKILLNLHEVGYIDSSGMGELVRTYTSIRGQGGQTKLVNPSKRVSDLLRMTHLSAVFDIQADEASAIHSFGQASSQNVA